MYRKGDVGEAPQRTWAPLCTDVPLSAPDKTLNLPLGRDHASHAQWSPSQQMGCNWKGCAQMPCPCGDRFITSLPKWTDEGIVCLRVIKQKFVCLMLWCAALDLRICIPLRVWSAPFSHSRFPGGSIKFHGQESPLLPKFTGVSYDHNFYFNFYSQILRIPSFPWSGGTSSVRTRGGLIWPHSSFCVLFFLLTWLQKAGSISDKLSAPGTHSYCWECAPLHAWNYFELLLLGFVRYGCQQS